jgi:DNA (cytosine-5)-methyltransferase 1
MSGTAQKPRLLDLFCGAGGAAMGYHRAGFEVVGIDIKPQKNYPFEFIQQGAIDYLTATLAYGFDAIHASPPCQAFTAYRRKGHGVGDGYPNLIAGVRRALNDLVVPYVIENVEQAREWMRDPATLCGSSFGLDVRRHRLFETNWPLIPVPCRHFEQKAKGKRFPGATNRDGRYTCEVGVYRIPLATQKAAMGVDWDVTLQELSQMVPPAFTEHVGWQMRACFETQWQMERERTAA